MAGALEDCLVVAGGLEAVEPKRKVHIPHILHLTDFSPWARSRDKYRVWKGANVYLVIMSKSKRAKKRKRGEKAPPPGVRSLLGSCRSEKRRGHKVYNQSVINLWGLIDLDPFPIIIVDALMHPTRNAWQFHYHRHREACPQKPKLYVFSPKIWGGV